MEILKRVNPVSRFIEKLGLRNGDVPVRLLRNSTDELVDSAMRKGKMPKLFGYEGFPDIQGRVEENYLYSTRRFPSNTANNTIGAGAVAAGAYAYFTSGVGDQGSTCGYFSISNLTYQQTNMAPSGKIPSGVGYELFDLGVSFNAGVAPADAVQCMDTMNLRFAKQNAAFQVYHGPIKFWPGGTGASGFATTTATTTTIQGVSNGLPSLNNVRRFSTPRVLSANEDFQYYIDAAAATPNSNTTVALTAFTEVTIWLFGRFLSKIPN